MRFVEATGQKFRQFLHHIDTFHNDVQNVFETGAKFEPPMTLKFESLNCDVGWRLIPKFFALAICVGQLLLKNNVQQHNFVNLK